MRNILRKTKLPTLAKKITPCKNCGAHVLQYFDYDNYAYVWRCSKCGLIRCEPGIELAVKFSTADQITK